MALSKKEYYEICNKAQRLYEILETEYSCVPSENNEEIFEDLQDLQDFIKEVGRVYRNLDLM